MEKDMIIFDNWIEEYCTSVTTASNSSLLSTVVNTSTLSRQSSSTDSIAKQYGCSHNQVVFDTINDNVQVNDDVQVTDDDVLSLLSISSSVPYNNDDSKSEVSDQVVITTSPNSPSHNNVDINLQAATEMDEENDESITNISH
jgi:hypothetical protein